MLNGWLMGPGCRGPGPRVLRSILLIRWLMCANKIEIPLCVANVLCSKNVHQLAERLPFQFSIDPNQRLNHLSNTMGYQSNALSNSNALLARTKMMWEFLSGGGRHSGCFAELGRTGSEVQFELAEFAKKRANQLFKDVLSKDGLGGGVGVHVDELSLQTKEAVSQRHHTCI